MFNPCNKKLTPMIAMHHISCASSRADARLALRVVGATTSLLLLCTFSSARAASLSFAPTKDATVKVAVPDKNFGSAAWIHTSGEAGQLKKTFLQFTVSGIPNGATNIIAKLKITADTTATGQDVTAYKVSNTSWGESSITWNNQPAMGAALATKSSHTQGQLTVWDVTAHVAGNGTYAIGLDSTFAGNTSFYSRETATPPNLVVSYTTGSSTWIWDMSGIHGGGMGQVVATDPFNANHATLGGDSWGVYNTTNAGNKWNAATKGLGVLNQRDPQPGDFHFMGVEYSRKHPGRVYALTGKLENPSAGNFGYVQGNSYTVITRTVRGGESTATGGARSERPRPTGKRVVVDYDSGTGVEYIYVGTGNGGGVKRSSNGGSSWTTIGLSGLGSAITGMCLDPSNVNKLYVATRANKAYRLNNIRGSATTTHLTAAPTRVDEVTAIGSSVYAAAHSSGIYKLTNNGTTWTKLGGSFFPTTSEWAAIGGTANTIYAGCAKPAGAKSIAKSTNGGTDWSWVTNPSQVSLQVWGRSENWWLGEYAPRVVPGNGGTYEAAQIEVDKFNANIVYVAGRSGCWVSKDGGGTWRPAMNGLGGTMHNNIAAGSGGISRTDDVDWTGESTSDHFYTASQSDPGALGGVTLNLTKNGHTYAIELSAIRDIKLDGVSIADEFFRATCVRPSDIDVSDDGDFIYVAQFGGGVLVGRKSGVAWP